MLCFNSAQQSGASFPLPILTVPQSPPILSNYRIEFIYYVDPAGLTPPFSSFDYSNLSS